jgi:glycosyltransferase involved in cell wall biosynthesis
MKPWLSILLPVYNVEPYLEECLNSVLSQAVPGVEVLVLDDASTDRSGEIARRRAASDPRLQCLRHDVNRGLSAARNTMLEVANGDYLWFVDSDDALEPGAISALQRIVQQHGPDMVLCDYRKWRQPMRLKHKLRGESHVSTFAGSGSLLINDPSSVVGGLFAAGQLHAWSKITRRVLWTGDLRFPVGRYFEDMAVSATLGLRSRSVWYQPEVWVAYRQRGGSILSTMDEHKADHLAHALERFTQEAALHVLTEQARFAWAHFAAKNFITACRVVSKSGAGTTSPRMRDYLVAMRKVMPMDVSELCAAYARRRWYWRRLRLRHWLDRAEAST